MANFRVGTPGNVAYLGRLGFAVGNKDFLESEASKVRAYWRGLEEGSTKFLGRQIHGLFGPGSRYAPAGKDFYSPGHGSGQQFFPLGFVSELLGGSGTPTARALRYLRGTAGVVGEIEGRRAQGQKGTFSVRGNGVVATIHNAIIAQNAYRDAYAAFQPAQREAEAVAQVLKDTGFVSGGFQSRSHGRVVGGQSFTRFADVRKRQAAPITSAGFRSRTGFLSGGATSGYTGSLANFSATFQHELTRINKLLAEGLAQKVAELQEEAIKRKATTTGKLVAATLDPRNRFPS